MNRYLSHELKGKKLKETSRLNEIILIEEINQLNRNGILPMFNLRCNITYVYNLLAVRNDLLYWV
jgi:hypothetical protein